MAKKKLRKVPYFKTDEEAEAFLEQDLSDLDWSQFKPVTFEFLEKDVKVNLRMPAPLLGQVKIAAHRRGIPYQRYIREVLEKALRPKHLPKKAGIAPRPPHDI